MRLRIVSLSSAVRRCFSSRVSNSWAWLCAARRSVSSERLNIRTGYPYTAHCKAICAPMVPAPTIPIVSKGLAFIVGLSFYTLTLSHPFASVPLAPAWEDCGQPLGDEFHGHGGDEQPHDL